MVTRHEYGISALVTQTSFREGSSGDLMKRRLFSQAIETSVSVTTNSPSQGYTHPDDHTLSTYDDSWVQTIYSSDLQ